MPNTTTAIADKLTAILTDHPDGITARDIARKAGQSVRAVTPVLNHLQTTATATCVPGATTGDTDRKSPDLWHLNTPTATGPAPTTAPDSTDGTDEETALIVPPSPTGAGIIEVPASGNPVPDAPVSAVPVSAAPVSAGQVSSADHFKVVMVAGVLGDHPDGVTAADVTAESGLRAAIVGRVLAAMETAGAAARKTAEDPGTELWFRGAADLSAVSLVTAPAYVECPTCGHRTRNRTTSGATRASAKPGRNADGQPTMGKFGLRGLVRDFFREHPDAVLTPNAIGRELGRSSGAVGNTIDKLVIAGDVLLVGESPMRYSAAPALTGPPTDQ